MTFEAVDLMECSQSGTLLHVGVVEQVLITLAILFFWCSVLTEHARSMSHIRCGSGAYPRGATNVLLVTQPQSLARRAHVGSD